MQVTVLRYSSSCLSQALKCLVHACPSMCQDTRLHHVLLQGEPLATAGGLFHRRTTDSTSPSPPVYRSRRSLTALRSPARW